MENISLLALIVMAVAIAIGVVVLIAFFQLVSDVRELKKFIIVKSSKDQLEDVRK